MGAGIIAAVLALSAQALGVAHEAPKSYTVAAGDTLWSISRTTGLSVEDLAAINAITDPNWIAVGQVLSLETQAAANAVSYRTHSTDATYAVQPGDTLSQIAAARGTTVEQLAQWNELLDPNVIQVGQVLRLEGAAWARAGGATALPQALWLGSPNFWAGRSQPPIALVLHTAAGSLPGIEAQFARPESEVSAHFGVGLDGSIHQYVALKDRAWANGILEEGNVWPGPSRVNPNDLTVSIEAEDLGNPRQAVTDAQYQATVAVGRAVLRQYPTVKYLVTHRAISPQTRELDPGPRWMASGRFQALAKELGLVSVE